MASIKRHPAGGWRAQVHLGGTRRTKVLPTKVEAANWASCVEVEIRAIGRGVFPKKSLVEAFTRYAAEVSPKKRTGDAEALRLTAFVRDYPDIAKKLMTAVTTDDMQKWVDDRTNKVSSGSVLRDLNLLSNVFQTARKKWKWCAESPITNVTRPRDNAPRTRQVQRFEIRRICRFLGYRTGRVTTKSHEVALAWLIALRTGMRASELLSCVVDVERRTATITQHKTVESTGRARVVPLSAKALRLLTYLSPGGFTITTASLDALFRQARDALMIENLHFHDSRAFALVAMSKKVPVEMLAKISGHKDLRTLMDHYYRVTPASIADMLDR